MATAPVTSGALPPPGGAQKAKRPSLGLGLKNSYVLMGSLAADPAKPSQLGNIDLLVHVLGVMLQEIDRQVFDGGGGPADGGALVGGVGHAGLDALADHVPFHFSEHAHHLEHPVGHGIQLVPAVDYERPDD